MKRRIRWQLPAMAVGLALMLILTGCGSTTSTTAIAVDSDGAHWPTQGWHTSTPEEEGVSSEQLAAVFERIARANYAIDSVTIIRHGSIVADAYVPPYGPQKRHIVHSCTKSVVSTLIGIAIDQGLIGGVDVPLLSLFEGVVVDNVDERKEALTLEDTLKMATGMDARDSYLYRWRGLTAMRESDDWTAFALSNLMVAEPGTRFDYSNTGSYLLSSALQRATGVTAADYADTHLFGPLGITDYDWPTSPEGVDIGWGEMWLTPHDMAKIGYLMLHDGRWEGAQIVPEHWVTSATAEQIEAGTLSDGYGYQWWTDDDGYFMALGYAGQYIVVLPDQDAVVVFTSALPDRDFFLPRDLVEQLIIPAMDSDSSLPANPKGTSRLAEAIEAFADR